MKRSSTVLQRLGTWLYPPELPNTKENSSSSPSTRFFSREAAGGGFEGFVWIACDQTRPLQGFLLTFSIERGWGTNRPSHHYKIFDSQTLVKLERKIGKVPCVCVCVSVCICVSVYVYVWVSFCKYDPFNSARTCRQLSLNCKSYDLSIFFIVWCCSIHFTHTHKYICFCVFRHENIPSSYRPVLTVISV